MKKQTVIVVPALAHILRAVAVVVLVIGILTLIAENYYYGLSCDGDCATRSAEWAETFSTFATALFAGFTLFVLANVVDYFVERGSGTAIRELTNVE